VLQTLIIQNYALIDNLQIGFNSGFSTITGETGAGKSIIMGALSLILGQRADISFLKNKEKKCIIEGVFSLNNNQLKNFFGEHDLDFSETIILRREITVNGNSRAFVNDTPVSLTIIKEIGINLVDIHSQHENLLLSNGRFQLSVLDAIAKNNVQLSEYKTTYNNYIVTQKKLNELKEQAKKNQADYDYFQFQLKQFENINLNENEVADLEQEKNILTHSGEIIENLNSAIQILSEGENPIISKLKELKFVFENLSKNYQSTNILKERIENIFIELKDISSELESIISKVEVNPERLSNILEKLDLIYTLEHKHKVNSVKELIEIKDDFRKKIESVELTDNEISKLESKLLEHYTLLKKRANILTENRKKASVSIEKSIIPMLKLLGIINANFKVQLSEAPEFTSTGKDIVKFLFSANKNIEPMDISKVASGGELSRLMLSIKSLIADTNEVETIIFDEIDTGISGEIAYCMSEIMHKMSKKIQVIAITHLPQIASRGENHYLVYKTNNKEKSETCISLLKQEDRITEIAKMLSGKEVTNAALENAKNLLKN